MRLEDWADDRFYEERKRFIQLLYERLISKGLGEDKALEETAETFQISAEEIKSILREQ